MKLSDQIGLNEQILWQGKKEKGVSVMEAIINPLLPVAILWGAFDVLVFAAGEPAVLGSGFFTGHMLSVITFFLLHMMPVWLYIGGVLTAGLSARHTEYAVTDKGVYIQTGIFSTRVEVKPFSEITGVRVHQGIFDVLFGTGDVSMNEEESRAQYSRRSVSVPTFTVRNVRDYEQVFRLIRDQQDAANAGKTFTSIPQGIGLPLPASVQPARIEPVFSNPQQGFDAVRGSFSAGSTLQPQTYGQPQRIEPIPQNYAPPPTPSLPPRNPVMPQDAFLKPLDYAQKNDSPQRQPVQPQFAVPELDSGFDLPEPADSFSDPTLGYFERGQQNNE